eukprot:scaffold308628_cov30-Tisochrysis_lutea.AAC.2
MASGTASVSLTVSVYPSFRPGDVRLRSASTASLSRRQPSERASMNEASDAGYARRRDHEPSSRASGCKRKRSTSRRFCSISPCSSPGAVYAPIAAASRATAAMRAAGRRVRVALTRSSDPVHTIQLCRK